MTSVMKNPLVVGSGAIALVGIGVYVYQLLFGLGITGMNNSTSWGLYLTCFMFFVGLSAGGLIVASSASIFGIKKYKAVALPLSSCRSCASAAPASACWWTSAASSASGACSRG